MTLEEALEYKPLFGKKHPDKTLHEIAMADPLYLDWYAGLKDIRDRERERLSSKAPPPDYLGDLHRA